MAPAVFEKEGRAFRSVAYSQLVDDGGHVGAYRDFGDEQSLAYLCGGAAVRQELENLPLALCKARLLPGEGQVPPLWYRVDHLLYECCRRDCFSGHNTVQDLGRRDGSPPLST